MIKQFVGLFCVVDKRILFWVFYFYFCLSRCILNIHNNIKWLYYRLYLSNTLICNVYNIDICPDYGKKLELFDCISYIHDRSLFQLCTNVKLHTPIFTSVNLISTKYQVMIVSHQQSICRQSLVV